jgi:hypothetical protein
MCNEYADTITVCPDGSQKADMHMKIIKRTQFQVLMEKLLVIKVTHAQQASF